MSESKNNSPTKSTFSIFTTRKTTAFVYGFVTTFTISTILLILNYSAGFSTTSLTSINNFFTINSTPSYRSPFSSFFSHFLPNSPHPNNPSGVYGKTPAYGIVEDSNFTDGSVKGSNFAAESVDSDESKSGSSRIDPDDDALRTGSVVEDSSSGGLLPRSRVGEGVDFVGKDMEENVMELLRECNLFEGRWVRDDSDYYPLYSPASCPYIDETFNCLVNGRPDSGYQKYRWQPKDCNLPRFNGQEMLKLLTNKRLVFVGDSLNRNMWESFVCMLRNSLEDKTRVFEASGREEFRTKGSYSFLFKDYNSSVEFFQSPFLMQEWEVNERNGSKRKTLRLDMVESSSEKYKNADILVYNTGHWWTHDKTSMGQGYYQEGSHIYSQMKAKEAFRKALLTWGRWVDSNIDPSKTLVFFRGFSSTHFRGGRCNSGGQCDGETEPITNATYLKKYPSKMRIFESVMNEMKTPILYLNITRMTGFRKDAHPSVYRKHNMTQLERDGQLKIQDCSHWCLPGVPDTWNELLYSQLLIKLREELRKNRRG